MGINSFLTKVEICLAQDIPEYLEGFLRCQHLNLYYGNGWAEYENTSQIEDTEYAFDSDLIRSVAGRLAVSESIVELIG